MITVDLPRDTEVLNVFYCLERLERTENYACRQRPERHGTEAKQHLSRGEHVQGPSPATLRPPTVCVSTCVAHAWFLSLAGTQRGKRVLPLKSVFTELRATSCAFGWQMIDVEISSV